MLTAIKITSSSTDPFFLIWGVGLLGYLAFIIVLGIAYVTYKNYSVWKSKNRVKAEIISRLKKVLKVFSIPALMAIYIIVSTIGWSVTIDAEGVHKFAPFSIMDRGFLPWHSAANVDILKAHVRGAYQISLNGLRGRRITIPIWDMTPHDAQLTCNIIFSQLQDSQLQRPREELQRVCARIGHEGEGMTSNGVQVTYLGQSIGK